MEMLQWAIVGLVGAGSVAYSVWRLLPRRRGGSAGCGSCSANGKPATKPH